MAAALAVFLAVAGAFWMWDDHFYPLPESIEGSGPSPPGGLRKIGAVRWFAETTELLRDAKRRRLTGRKLDRLDLTVGEWDWLVGGSIRRGVGKFREDGTIRFAPPIRRKRKTIPTGRFVREGRLVTLILPDGDEDVPIVLALGWHEGHFQLERVTTGSHFEIFLYRSDEEMD